MPRQICFYFMILPRDIAETYEPAVRLFIARRAHTAAILHIERCAVYYCFMSFTDIFRDIYATRSMSRGRRHTIAFRQRHAFQSDSLRDERCLFIFIFRFIWSLATRPGFSAPSLFAMRSADMSSYYTTLAWPRHYFRHGDAAESSDSYRVENWLKKRQNYTHIHYLQHCHHIAKLFIIAFVSYTSRLPSSPPSAIE